MRIFLTFLFLITCVLLVGCNTGEGNNVKKDVVIYSLEEQVSLSDYITIVKIEKIIKTETVIWGGDIEMPKTFFKTEKITDIKGINETDIELSRIGGYKGNKFYGLRGDNPLMDGSLKYNLYEIGKYYLVAYKIENNDTMDLYYKKLEGYDEAKSHLEQDSKNNEIIQEYYDEVRRQREEAVSLSDFVTIVKIEEIIKSETVIWGSDIEIPKTFFKAEKIADIKGINETDIELSRLGGYKENKFHGIFINYPSTSGSLAYNLYEIGKYYLVAYKIETSDTKTYQYIKLNGYDETKSHLEQNFEINEIIQEYLREIDKQQQETTE